MAAERQNLPQEPRLGFGWTFVFVNQVWPTFDIVIWPTSIL
jgi:hypothetical protein